MSPFELRRNAWLAEGRQLQNHLDNLPLVTALAVLLQYHVLTGYSKQNPDDLRAFRCWRTDRRMSLVGYHIESRNDRLKIKEQKAPPEGVVPVADGCPLAVENQFWQQGADQFAYTRAHNGKWFNYLVQYRPFGAKHFTIASVHPEPQDWRPSLDTLHRRMLDEHAIAAQLGCLLLHNGDGAAASLDWNHVHALAEPEDGPLPIRQAVRLAGDSRATVLRLDEPYWPLPAYRITGPAETVAGEVCTLAARCSRAGGASATESIAMYSDSGGVTCIFVPRDREREYSESFHGKLGAFETATGSLVFSDRETGAMLRDGRLGFDGLWSMLREARPEWSDDI